MNCYLTRKINFIDYKILLVYLLLLNVNSVLVYSGSERKFKARKAAVVIVEKI